MLIYSDNLAISYFQRLKNTAGAAFSETPFELTFKSAVM